MFLPGDTADQCLVNVEFCDANGHRQTRTVSLPDAMALRACLGASQERSTREGMGAGGLSIPASPAGEGGVLFLTLAALSSHQAPSLTAGDHCRMTELLIGAVSWLATFGFIVAAIAEAFR